MGCKAVETHAAFRVAHFHRFLEESSMSGDDNIMCTSSTSYNMSGKWKWPVNMKLYKWWTNLFENMKCIDYNTHRPEIFLTRAALGLWWIKHVRFVLLSHYGVSEGHFWGDEKALWKDFHFTNIFTALTVCNLRGHGSQFTSLTTTSACHMRQPNINASFKITSKRSAFASGLVVRIN